MSIFEIVVIVFCTSFLGCGIMAIICDKRLREQEEEHKRIIERYRATIRLGENEIQTLRENMEEGNLLVWIEKELVSKRCEQDLFFPHEDRYNYLAGVRHGLMMVILHMKGFL